MIKDLTLVIPTYNRNNYLVKLLNTIPPDFPGQVIINDNGNYVLDSIKLKYPKYIFYTIEPQLKMFENWNNAISKVQTKYFMIPSDDDLFLENTFSTIQHVFFEFENYDILIFGHFLINEKDERIGSWQPSSTQVLKNIDAFKIFSKGVNARFPSIIFKKEKVVEMGLFDKNYEFTASDSFLIQKCLLFGKSVFVAEIISSYRIWQNNFTNKLISTQAWMDNIKKWTNDLSFTLHDIFSKDFTKKEIMNISDEILATNMLSSLLKIKNEKGLRGVLNYFKFNGYPKHASLRTQFQIFITLIK